MGDSYLKLLKDHLYQIKFEVNIEFTHISIILIINRYTQIVQFVLNHGYICIPNNKYTSY